jgi:hypothetical protein
MTENVLDLIGVHHSHPLPPRVRARSLWKFRPNILLAYISNCDSTL